MCARTFVARRNAVSTQDRGISRRRCVPRKEEPLPPVKVTRSALPTPSAFPWEFRVPRQQRATLDAWNSREDVWILTFAKTRRQLPFRSAETLLTKRDKRHAMFIDTDVSSDSFDDAIREFRGGKLRKEKKRDKIERQRITDFLF